MSAVRMTAPTPIGSLSTRQKLTLTHAVLAPSDAILLPDVEIDVLFLKTKRVPIAQLRAARLTPLDLKARGLHSALELRELGYDALDLNDSGFCGGGVAAFGAENIKMAFLLEAGDAVALSGSTAIFQLGITTEDLLRACAGCPAQAKVVLTQAQPRGGALQGTDAGVVLDTGLRAPQLCELGYFGDKIQTQTGASPVQMRSFGFL